MTNLIKPVCLTGLESSLLYSGAYCLGALNPGAISGAYCISKIAGWILRKTTLSYIDTIFEQKRGEFVRPHNSRVFEACERNLTGKRKQQYDQLVNYYIAGLLFGEYARGFIDDISPSQIEDEELKRNALRVSECAAEFLKKVAPYFVIIVPMFVLPYVLPCAVIGASFGLTAAKGAIVMTVSAIAVTELASYASQKLDRLFIDKAFACLTS